MLHIREKSCTFVVQLRDTHNLTPKTRKGSSTMKPETSKALNVVTKQIESLMNAVERDTLMAILEELIDKTECYSRLMDNGRMITETLSGPRFQRIYKKRLQCWSFIQGLHTAQRIIIKKL